MWDVVIVGAGPTGLTAANLLGQAGIRTLLLERNAGLSSYPKAISIDDEGLAICQSIGLVDEVQSSLILDISACYVSHGHYLAQVTPVEQPYGYPLISTFHQPTFEAILLQGLTRFACVQIQFQHYVETLEQNERGARLHVCSSQGATTTVECGYVLACDGGRSTIRQALGIALRPVAWHDLFSHSRTHTKPASDQRRSIRQPQRWLVVDCEKDTDATRSAIFFCNPTRPAVTLPAPNEGRRWEFMLLPGEHEQDVLNETTIQQLITEALADSPDPSDTPNTAIHIARMAVYTFQTMLATQFRRGRVFLLGDAAHLMPPFGGQGMNSGLRDAANLCATLQRVLRQQADPRLLESYEQQRRPQVAQMILFSSLLGAIVTIRSRQLAWLRDLFFRGINHISPLHTLLKEMRVKPRAHFKRPQSALYKKGSDTLI